jgi:predicted ATPase/signal transduction histidine kinase
MQIPFDIEIREQIRETSRTSVFRGRSGKGQGTVILKVLKGNPPSPGKMAGFRQEYEILRSFHSDQIVQVHSLHPYGDSLAMVLEDFNGLPLTNIRNIIPYSLEKYLKIAIRITDALDEIHRNAIIHQNLNPANLLYNPDSGQLKIIDFSLAFGGATPGHLRSVFPDGNPAYMSPEQTGRMNVLLDRRSDLYSLGICIYEFLTGAPPFQGDTLSEMIRLHCTRPPRPPEQVNPEIPPILSKIILKLLEKSAADRYQSCAGLRNDLVQFLHDRKALGKSPEFLLGLHEASSIFRIPKTLLGRLREQEALQSACNAAAAGKTEVMVVRGPPGIGKTALVQAMEQYGEGKRAYLLHGRCEQFPVGIPYLPIIRAFRGLAHCILSDNDAAIRRWKKELLAALGANGRVVLDLVPELEGLIGEQPSVPELPAEQAGNRFRMVLDNFLKACTACASPLILFLDKVQWADPDSIRLIADLLADSSLGGLLLVCAEDGEGQGAGAPSGSLRQALENSGRALRVIDLAPLGQGEISALLSETLLCPPDRVADLARICLEKSRGVPLSVKEFLLGLHRDGLLAFDGAQMCWQWDMAAIEKRDFPADPAEMFAVRMRAFPERAQGILKMAALLGDCAGGAELLGDKPQEDRAEHLQLLVEQGLLVPTEQLFCCPLPLFEPDEASSENSFCFVHEEARRAAFSLIAGDERAGMHQGVAARLEPLAGLLNERLFAMVGHANRGLDETAGPEEKIDCARKNLQAGRKAVALGAAHQAAVFFETGLRLLPSDCWRQRYDLALSLHLEAIAAGGRSPEEAEPLVDAALANGASMLDKARACQSLLRLQKARNRQADALQTGLIGLAWLGMRLPFSPRGLHVRLAGKKMQLLLAKVRIDRLLHLPMLTNSSQRMILELISDIMPIARAAAPGLLQLLIFRALAITMRHGNSPHSAGLAYAPYGALQCGLPNGDIGRGNAFGMLAVNLQELQKEQVGPETLYLVGSQISHWKNHVQASLPGLRTAWRLALDAGDFDLAADALLACTAHLYWSGSPLPDSREEMEKNGALLKGLGRTGPLHCHRLYQQAVENLLGKSGGASRSPGVSGNASSPPVQDAAAGDPGAVFLRHLLQMVHCYLFSDLEQAQESLVAARAHLPVADASIAGPLFVFYGSLIEIARYHAVSASEQRAIRKRFAVSQRKMKKWADWAPMNHRHRYWLVEAERARVLGREAQKFYDRAVRQVRESRNLQEEGLVYEVVSRYHATIERDQIALLYAKEARNRYERWGAWAKVRQLDASLPGGAGPGEASPSQSPAGTAPLIDVEALIDASRRLMDEIVLEELLLKMTGIMIETAGAQQGLLFTKEKEGWSVRVKGSMSGRQVLESHRPASFQDTPLSVVQAVAQTGKTVVLHDPGEAGPFADDGYLARCKPKAVLCTPIVYQDEILCIVYLENDLTSEAFPPVRQELIRLLSSLAALSVRNSNLYEKFSATVERLHEEIDKRQAAQLQLLHAEKLSALGRLSASIAHEFGNPLIGVRYLLEDIKNRPALDREDQELLEIGLEECNRMKHLINDLQQLNKPSSGKHKSFNVHTIIDNVLLFQKKNMSSRKIAIAKDYDPGLPEIVAVEDQITQVLVNLVINAVDAIPEEGGCITVATAGKGDSIRISVRDSGAGIRPEDLEHIFEPFFSTKPAAEGTGLGLPVSYGIIAGHGGAITCSSTLGQGTTFTVSLPVSPARMPSEADQ